MKLSKYFVSRIRADYLTFTLTNKAICDKYKIHHTDLSELEKRRTFRIIERDWKAYKRCTNCDVWKEWTLENYHKSWDTLSSTCKYCRCLIARNDRKLRPEIHREISKRRNIKDADKRKAYQKQYREANKEKARLYQIKYKKRNEQTI